MKQKVKHKHHIIPKHMGGTDHKDNIIELTIEEHAEAHKLLYEKYGKREDYIAWCGLSGMLSTPEIEKERLMLVRKRQSESGKKVGGLKSKEAYAKSWNTRRNNGRGSAWNKGLKKEDHEGLKKLSVIMKEKMAKNELHNIGDSQRGKKFSMDHRKTLSDKAKQRTRVKCEYCDKETTPQMYSRWHGDNCKENVKHIGK